MISSVKIIEGDCIATLRTLPSESVHCCVTSPPYWGLRDYGCNGQLGLELTPASYVQKMVEVFREVRRVLRADGTLWLNLGDTYAPLNRGKNAKPRRETFSEDCMQRSNTASDIDCSELARACGLKEKNLVGIPWMVAFALRDDGWYLRSEIIWHKPNPMPESVMDRPTKSHETIFLLSKEPTYFYDYEAVREPAIGGWNGSDFLGEKNLAAHPDTSRKPRRSVKRGGFNGKTNELPGREAFRAVTEMRNRRSVWTVATQPYAGAHFATYPPLLIRPCILAGCPAGGTVLDPFGGSGTTGQVALELGRSAILCELNPDYVKLSEERLRGVTAGLGF